ncbi:phenoloxidase-activating factor 2-like [Sitodiplosis mosellana]|uniref:phenoloxidase-activating factor 2-like n=1 Tax=Sitodiplosis mosellana TaxID=263140 RepID=UPI0024446B75|nr:phenoloxidase-activating factor 2-like [Sitodiplosis mosellana]
MRLLLCFTVAALLGSNVHCSDTTLNVDEMLTQTTQITETTEAVTSGGCSSCAAIAEETALESKLSNPCEYGECVPYYLCLNGSIITSGEGILDVRFGAEDDPEPERHPCSDFFDTCCTLKSTEIVKEKVKPPIEKHDKCGIRNIKGSTFTLIGRENEAQFAEFPWVSAVIYKVHDNEDIVNVYKCGGSLIHPNVVMTVAHCVIDLPNVHDILIRSGEWDTQTVDEPYPHQDRAVTEVLIHENYRRGSHFNDIALLILGTPVELTENVNTACLPPHDYVFDHQRCQATGWGKDKFGKDGLYQVILKKVELPVVPREECQTKLRETRLGRHFILDHSFICAGGEKGKDTCQGDGGSPLNCEIPNNEYGQYYVTGEVAWGIGCFDPVPGVYVNVPKFRPWVDKIFDERNYDKKFYTAI